MEPKFTPGPWCVEKCIQVVPGRGDWEMIGTKTSFDVIREGADGKPYYPDTICTTDDDNEANARLIAAAPDMYAALSEIEREVGEGRTDELLQNLAATSSDTAWVARLAMKCRWVLSQARGESEPAAPPPR